MVRRAIGLLLAVVLPLGAQSSKPLETRLDDVVPSGIRTTQIALTPDARRAYYGDTSHAVWLYDRTDKRNVRLVNGEAWDLTVSPTGTALAYMRTSPASADQHVWILPLDPRTGVAAGPERRASAKQGDAPAISADGKWLAFAADDSAGVGQSLVVVAVSGGQERTIVPSMRASISNIRWSPDGRSLFYGVNPPVPCNPDWSCLPLKREFQQTTGSVRRVAFAGSAPTVIVSKVGSAWPGLSADGSVLVYSDTGLPAKFVVADTAGHPLRSIPAPPRQTIEGWLTASTLVFSDRGDVRRLRSYSIANGATGLLIDSLEQMSDPAYAPDGQSISTIQCAPDQCSLRISRADGSRTSVFPLPERFGNGTVWSPDGRWIAYISAPVNGDRRVNALEVSSGRVTPLETVRATAASAIWTADSRALVVTTTNGTGAARRVAFDRVGLDGQVRKLREYTVGAPPSAGGVVSATTGFLIRDGDDVRRIGIDGDSTETQYFQRTGGRTSGFVSVSPDGERLAFRRSHDKDDQDLDVVEIMNPDGSNRVTVELPFGMFNFSNSMRLLPGGKQFVVLAAPWREENDVGVYLVTVDTKTVKKLFAIPLRSFTGDVTVSPDGRTVLYVGAETTAPRVFTMDVSAPRDERR